LVAKALKAVGCDRAGIRDYLENKTAGFVGQHGIFNFSTNDHIGLTFNEAFLMVVVKGDDWALAK
jgi:branched-chain amino acid transport system substrate-binding protein